MGLHACFVSPLLFLAFLSISCTQSNTTESFSSTIIITNMSPDDLNLPTPQLKNTIQKNLASAKKRVSQEAAKNQQEQWKNRWKSSLRTVIALLIIGVTFVIVWLQIGRACI